MPSLTWRQHARPPSRRSGPTSQALELACRRLGVYAVVGLLEADAGRIYNSALLVGPDGLLARYRKTHLPCLGVDRFVDAGQALDVHDTPIGRLGLLICYDLRFPEAARVLALHGADVIVHPTNWHWTSDDFPDFINPARARESRVYVLSADRWGHEGELVTWVAARSWISPARCWPKRQREGDAILHAQLDLARARQKHLVLEPGVFESDVFADRRPDLYGRLSAQSGTAS